MAQHISLRVPWHDMGWNGAVCKNPQLNQSCTRLKNIYENKNDALEMECSECKMCNIDELDKIPCIREGGGFMSDDEIAIKVQHPYVQYGYETHKHLLPTNLLLPPYSYPARPYRWTMKKRYVNNELIKIEDFAVEKGINYSSEIEPTMKKDTWVQNGINQRAIFDTFFQDVEPDNSICVFYAKQVPFIEDNRRVIIGLGHVKQVIKSADYETSDENGMKSCLWETVIQHTIRPGFKDGFLIPYDELMKYAEEHEEFDIRKTTVFADDDFFDEFSYASEHLSYDAVIDVILQCIKVLGIVKECGIKGNWDECIEWLNQELVSVWEDRGAFPGLGPMLCAFGIPSGVVVARELKKNTSLHEDIWESVEIMFDEPEKVLTSFFAKQITSTLKNTWKKLPKKRKLFFQLLSRVSLSLKQADVLYNPEVRENNKIICTDEDIINNPYRLYEITRDKIEDLKISIKKVDLAFFPVEHIKKQYPVEKTSLIESENDERRVRAIAISVLEKNAENGNTIMPVNNLVLDINDLHIEPKCPVTGDIIAAMEDYFIKEIVVSHDALKKPYYKLSRYNKIDAIIRNQVDKRLKSSNRHKLNVDWKKRIDDEFGEYSKDDVLEKNARNEKAKALEILSESRLSVLVGGAGTGKTTVLELLCKEKAIQNGGIYLLAPTGKARVRMSLGMKNVEYKAFTVAQFLSKTGRYDAETFTYKILSKEEKAKNQNISIPETVIIDEASMLTEEMFGALLDAIKTAGRIIFVGDKNQLPPIGAGRPFVDLVRYIETCEHEHILPGECYAKLITTRRQKQEENENDLRADIRLSKWYTETDEQLDEEIFSEIQSGVNDGTVVFKQWKDKDELERLLLETIMDATGMNDINDIDGFNESLGASIIKEGKYVGQTYFNNTRREEKGCAKAVENWQILSPVRNNIQGVLNINHFIHEKFRENYLELASKEYRYRKIPAKMGPEGIVYGDKVINLENTSSRKAFPKKEYNYIANGEIGMACGNFGNKNTLDYLHVEFSSQLGYTYSYQKTDFGDEVSAPLELAYALTVHKSQGSQFKSVILVISDKCRLLSKELLYTALTRQEDRLYILYDEEIYNLKKYSSMEYSDIACRYTDLFTPPKIVEVNNHYYEENLIHRAKDGTMLRSKSEVVIANMLYDNDVDYLYEEKLPIGNSYKLPDFTIVDAAMGTKIIWEHCGMLTNPIYRKKWNEKKRIYELNGYSEENGNLIITKDLPNGGIDSQEIQRKIDEYLL